MSQLKSIIERIERMHEEKRAIESDIKDIYAEAKANGFDSKALREVVKLRAREAKDPDGHAELESLVELYLRELGTPLATQARDAREAA